jgi:hypothetical protein
LNNQSHLSKCTFGPQIVNLLSWLEDCTDLYVRLIRNPAGIGFPDEEFPVTRIHSVQESVQVGDLGRVLLEHIQENIWRSWQLFSNELCSAVMSHVPLFFDIDNQEHNLEDAYTLTRDCLDVLEGITQFHAPDRLRVVFSGMKGFHIEGRPTDPVDNRSIRETLLTGLKKKGLENMGTTNWFITGIIDPGHEFIRLTGSFNSWKEENILKRRKVIQLTVEEFRKLQVKNIIERSESV